MNIRSETPGSPLSAWVSSLIGPIVNGLLILTLFPAPVTFAAGLVDELVRSTPSMIESAAFLEQCSASASVLGDQSSNGSESTSKKHFACTILDYARGLLTGEISSVVASLSWFGLAFLAIFLILLHKATRTAFTFFLGASDIREDLLALHPEISIDPYVNAVTNRCIKSDGTSASLNDFERVWPYVKTKIDEVDNAPLYHRRRDFFVSKMYIWREQASFVACYTILSFFTFFISIDNWIRSSFESGGIYIFAYLFLFFAFSIYWIISSQLYLRNCIDIVKLDFETYFNRRAKNPILERPRTNLPVWDERNLAWRYVKPLRGGILLFWVQ